MPLDPKSLKIEGGKLTIDITKSDNGNINLDFSQSLTNVEKAEILCILSMAAIQTLDAVALTVILHKSGQAQILNAESMPMGLMADAMEQVVKELKKRAKEVEGG